MKKLVLICILLQGLLHTATCFASGIDGKKHLAEKDGFASCLSLPASEPDIVNPVQVHLLQHSSRQVTPNIFTAVHYLFQNNGQPAIVHTAVLTAVFYNKYLDHIYPSHNFW